MVVHHTPLCLTNDDILVVVPPILIWRYLHPQLYLYKCIDSGVWCLCTTLHTLCPIYNLVWYTTIQPVLSCMVVYHTNVIALGACRMHWQKLVKLTSLRDFTSVLLFSLPTNISYQYPFAFYCIECISID